MNRAMRTRALAAAAVVVLLAVVAVVALGRDDGTKVKAPAGPGPGPSGPTIPPSEATVAVVFSRPLSLAQVRDLAARNDATPVALWRTEGVCVLAVSGAGPRGALTRDRRLSAFAYVDYEVMLAAQQKGPPVTDGGWTFALRERFSDEWRQAQSAGVQFRGAAFVMRNERAQVAGVEVRRVEAVPSYRPDTGVLFLRNHEEALAPTFPDTDRSPC